MVKLYLACRAQPVDPRSGEKNRSASNPCARAPRKAMKARSVRPRMSESRWATIEIRLRQSYFALRSAIVRTRSL
jgi:hypothetical protein